MRHRTVRVIGLLLNVFMVWELHIDGFGHRFFDGKMWNGVDMEETVTMEEGAKVNSVLTMKDGVVTRGVLYDIPRLLS